MAPPGNQAVNGENKHQSVSGETVYSTQKIKSISWKFLWLQ
jgi:hypothetical protein